MSRALTLGLVAGAVLVVTLSFFAGRSLQPQTGAAYDFDASAPAYESGTAAAGLSKGGFTGFVEATDARTVVSGRVVSWTANSITLQRADGSTTTLRVTALAPLHRLEVSERGAIRPGVQVLVRRDGDAASAVLVLGP